MKEHVVNGTHRLACGVVKAVCNPCQVRPPRTTAFSYTWLASSSCTKLQSATPENTATTTAARASATQTTVRPSEARGGACPVREGMGKSVTPCAKQIGCH